MINKYITLLVLVFLVGCFSMAPHPIEGYRELSPYSQHEIFENLSIEEQMSSLIWDVENMHHIDYELWHIFERNGEKNIPYINAHIQSLNEYSSYWLWRWLNYLREYQEKHTIQCNEEIVYTLGLAIDKQKDGVYMENVKYLYSRLKNDCHTANKAYQPTRDFPRNSGH